MTSNAATPEQYLAEIPEERRAAMERLRSILKAHLPPGFEERMAGGMLNYVVPHSLYPNGYHCNPKQALPFISVASQKNFIALYHMGMYSDPELLDWFVSEYPKHSKTKLDMGKSCIRFKKPDAIPFALLEQLAGKMSPQRWIEVYESQLAASRK
ncbi:DUF1801 domain-containing protein [Flaviaesturariibacter amylovorans]|uniref:DUF1801 domain-containing protein n=1 Tax=Flaviaesturariibacter amylovorans TaxID=1084520 RepID=A0ABP8HUU4_9BACT